MGDKRCKKRRNRRWILLFPVFLFAGGLAVLVYPHIADGLYQRETEKLRLEFEEEREEDGADYEALYQELRRRNEELYRTRQQDLADPFTYEQPDIDLSAYGLENNIIAYIRIPKMEITLPVLLGANQENMSLGAVHLTETSYPVGGVNTNSVLAAHRGYSKAAMFRDIEALEIGDEVIIENFRETLMYEVCELKVISPVDVEKVLIREGRDMVTLITCHPYRHNYQRYVVYCERKE